MATLKERIELYQNLTDFRLLNRVPLIITINGRSFSKTTSLLDKPFCANFAECMYSVMAKLCMEIDGAVFAYYFNDEIVFVVKNDNNIDTNPWCDNKIQKICSITSSIASLHFNECAKNMELNLLNNSIFISNAFIVPSIIEATNTIIYKQQQNSYISIQFACFYELLKKYDKLTIKEMLSGLSIDEKINLLKQESDIDFNKYHSVFRRGAACYRKSKINDNTKSQWVLNEDLPIFTQEQSFLKNIFI